MLGKPPSIAYEGIGFNAQAPVSPSTANSLHWPTSPTSTYVDTTHGVKLKESSSRQSSGSSAFSDYDDLRDFDGRFESRSTLGCKSSGEQRARTISESKNHMKLRKPSRGILGRLRGANGSHSQPPQDERLPSGSGGRKLKALRSMGSLKGRSSTTTTQTTQSLRKTSSPPWLAQPPEIDVGLGLDGLDWDSTVRAKRSSTQPASLKSHGAPSLDLDARPGRASGRRSISFGANMGKSPVRDYSPSVPSIPPFPLSPREELVPTALGSSYQAMLGNALIAASHAESSKGTHGDLLQILNHDRLPWGFSYTAYPHHVRIWYGDRDEKIAENAVRWMETAMGSDKCQVKVVKGADHSLMFKSSVVVDVLEYIGDCWKSGKPPQSSRVSGG